jgi:ribosomal-protein-alanine N-acetyltransferase
MRLETVGAGQAAALARLHATSFTPPWSAADIAGLLDGPGGFGLAAFDDAETPQAFILARAIAGEAEILTLAVAPARRREGLARALVEAAAGSAAVLAAESLFLEVAADNAGAIGLYRAAGFAEVGRRRGYYPRSGAPAVDALIMRRDLNSAPA